MPDTTDTLSPARDRLRSGRLGAGSVAFLTLAAAGPFLVVGGVIPTGMAQTGLAGFLVAFVVVGAAFAVYCVGYLAMGRQLPSDAPGGFYPYISSGLGRVPGVGATWVAVVAYTALTVGLYGLIGDTASTLLETATGVRLPWWLLAATALGVVSVFGLAHITTNRTVLGIFLVAEIAVILTFITVDLTHPAPGPLPLDLLTPGSLFGHGGGTFALLALSVLGIVGAELAPLYRNEAREPRRGVARATYATIAVLVGIFALATWAMAVNVGRDNLVAAAADTKAPPLFFAGAVAHLGPHAATVGQAFLITSALAGALAFHNTAVRYLSDLGRDRTGPAILGRRSSSGTPKVASLVQSAVGGIAILAVAISGAEPMTALFYFGGTSGAVGIITLLTVTAVAIVVYFARHPHAVGTRVPWVRVSSVIAALALAALLVLVVANLGALLNEPDGSAAPVVVFGIYLGAFLVGVVWALRLRHTDPARFDAIADPASAAVLGGAR